MTTTLKQGASKQRIQKLFSEVAKSPRTKGVNTLKYCGKIKLKEDALVIQKRLRDEWQ